MSLVFGAATSDRVDCGHASPVQDLTTFSIACWVYVTTLTGGRTFFSKGLDSTSSVVQFNLTVTGGNITLQVRQATTNIACTSSNTPIALNAWRFIAATYDQGASPRAKMFSGQLGSTVSEVTYSGQTDGSGNKKAEGTVDNLVWGNGLQAGSYTAAIQGRIARGYYFNRVLSLADFKILQFGQAIPSGCVNYLELGYAGTGTHPDWSGNSGNGTVTGAAIADHVPLGLPFSLSRDTRVFPAVASTAHAPFYYGLMQQGR